jgi:hypothetical protein
MDDGHFGYKQKFIRVTQKKHCPKPYKTLAPSSSSISKVWMIATMATSQN